MYFSSSSHSTHTPLPLARPHSFSVTTFVQNLHHARSRIQGGYFYQVHSVCHCRGVFEHLEVGQQGKRYHFNLTRKTFVSHSHQLFEKYKAEGLTVIPVNPVRFHVSLNSPINLSFAFPCRTKSLLTVFNA